MPPLGATSSLFPSEVGANTEQEVLVGISDLHLGAFNSTWSFFIDQDDPQLRRVFSRDPPEYNLLHSHSAWDLCQRVLNSIDAEVADLAAGRPVGARTLVLIGDILDLSLGPTALAFLNARCLFHFLHESKKFSKIVYVPGNHDHHVWRMVVEADMLQKAVAGGSAKYERCSIAARPALALAQMLDVKTPLTVAYPHYLHPLSGPNFGSARPWQIVFHHGHLLERWWTLLSDALASPSGKMHSIEELEAINEPLTELLWFSVGDAGRLSDMTSALYTGSSDARGLRRKVDDILEGAASELSARSGVARPWWLPLWLVRAVVPRLVGRLSAPRSRPERMVAAASTLRGDALGGELLRAVTSYRSRYAPVTPSCFIFGHTHRTQSTVQSTDTKHGIDLEAASIVSATHPQGFDTHILNTGGWVVEPRGKPPDASIFIAVGEQLRLVSVDIPDSAIQVAQAGIGLR
ncbi:MAG: hypothetical protein AB1714_01815 [Acidobacteriota bacterium]